MTSTRPTGAESPLDALPDRRRSLREAGPVAYDETQGQRRVVGHQEVFAVLADPATHSSGLTSIAPTRQDSETFRQGDLVGMDPPEHRTLRTLVSQAFTLGTVHGPAPRVEAVCARLPDGVARSTAPDVFDAARSPNPRPTFGHGIHFRFGAPPARLEAGVVPHMLMERFPALAVPSYDDVAYQNPAVTVGVRHLPVAVTRA
ncbi:hypothetical protein [Streptomyces sp. NPDC058632]|uniref:hypothetical protein n=1 Tax=unclassified Streptomyces TaxID=2593676 RepID=UPI00364B9FB3